MTTKNLKTLSKNEDGILLKKVKGPLATITLNEPNKMNVLSVEMLNSIQESLDDLSKDKSVRVIILEANGKAFCTGHDLKDMRSNYTYEYQCDHECNHEYKYRNEYEYNRNTIADAKQPLPQKQLLI